MNTNTFWSSMKERTDIGEEWVAPQTSGLNASAPIVATSKNIGDSTRESHGPSPGPGASQGGSPGQVSFKSTPVSNDPRQVCNSLGDDIIEDSRPTIVESDPRANASVAAPYADAVAGVTRQACRASDADIDTDLK